MRQPTDGPSGRTANAVLVVGMLLALAGLVASLLAFGGRSAGAATPGWGVVCGAVGTVVVLLGIYLKVRSQPRS
ncbi:hypothetical protein [Thalassiella azotivora]